MSMKLVKRITHTLAVLCLSAMLLPLGELVAQTIPPTPDIDTRARKKSTLTKEQQEAVGIYAELLGELRMTLKDYREYLQESESQKIKDYLVKMDRFVANLDKNAYVKDREQLVDDLEIHIGVVEELEEYISESEEIFPMKTYRVVQSLNRDISAYQDLLEDQIHGELADLDIDEAELQAQLRQLSREMAEIERNADKIEAEAERQAAKAYKLDQKEIDRITKEAERAAKAATKGLKNVPTPAPPVVIYTPKGAPAAHGTGTSREMTGTLSVSDKLPIFISNRFGSVTVAGEPGGQISAAWSLELQAGSRQQEKDFLNQASLKLTHEKDGYHVHVIMPEMDNRSIRIANSILEVEVPANNKVIIDNSFGEVEVSDLNAGVDVTNAYGSITVSDVKGPANITNSMGPLEVDGITGPMKLQNAYAPISATGCSGDLTVENSYAPVEISGCKGKVTIRNSGNVQLDTHVGNVDINNSFGQVEVSNLDGDLQVQNQYQPVSVSDIKGAVILQNANSPIEIYNVRGSLSANNAYSTISAEDLAGPVKLINKNGSIALVLDERFKGNSTIQTTFGNVELTIPRTANALVRARTTHGDIRSYMPLQVDQSGQSKVAVMKFGRAADSLSIVAENASITISDK